MQADRRWDALIQSIDRACAQRGVPPAQVVVVVPYAQLMDIGRKAWARHHPDGYVPRFETTRNWATALHPFLPGPSDLCLDAARDSLVATALLARVIPPGTPPDLRMVMVRRLMDSARPLAAVVAAIPPEQRAKWVETLQQDLFPALGALQWEGLVGVLALTWASASSYGSDVLWTDLAAPGRTAQLLVVVKGFQPDPLVDALQERWGDRAVAIPWVDPALPDLPGGECLLHACDDAEDEAQRAAACVMRQIQLGHVPVALVATDRLITRRISALLHAAGVRVHDETGWKLSTTHVAAQLMCLLRAATPLASMDDVLALLKHGSGWAEQSVQAMELRAREQGVSSWRMALQSQLLLPLLPAGLVELLAGLQAPRSLVRWLETLTATLQQLGWWSAWQGDEAGKWMVQVLRLGEGAAQELAGLGHIDSAARPLARESGLSLGAFTAWVRDVLEGATFLPVGPDHPEAVILPMPHLLGRSFAAAVVPGCDEVRLNPSPEPAGEWTATARERLGLPARETLAQSARQAWWWLLQSQRLDVLWRTQDQGEPVLPNAWVMALQSAGVPAAGEPRQQRELTAASTGRPFPSAPDLLSGSLSASAYQDLRNCPYRFFAQRQLRLADVPELDVEPDQRDFGNWLHAVLRTFHEERADDRPGRTADAAALDRIAHDTTVRMGLRTDEGAAGFLPYEVVWPSLRDGYLDWLAQFEAAPGRAGPRFLRAEAELTAGAGPWKLYGKLDRIDAQHSPEGPIPFVIDYKTESRSTTQARLKEPLEDVQLAFYAALMPDDTLRAGYLSINDRPGSKEHETRTQLMEHNEVLQAREQLREGLVQDLGRIAGGHALAALGEGRVCAYCAVRGLCRKDFWEGA